MKKLVSLALALLLALTAFIIPAMAEEVTVIRSGMLTQLNMTEDEMVNYINAQQLALRQLVKEHYTATVYSGMYADGADPEIQIVFYDSLDAMLMALTAGDIDNMYVYSTTGIYLCYDNPELVEGMEYYEKDGGVGTFASMIYDGILANDFSFMMMEDNAALRDEFNAAIDAIYEDEGAVMDKLIDDQIIKLVSSGEIVPVEMPVIEGAETIKVAVTGAMPPMDYIAPDGTPAGFNTALLAEISKRINKNIEIVVVDSIGRAAALASGTVDVVFWTRTNSIANRLAEMDEAEEAANRAELESMMDAEEIELMDRLSQMTNFAEYGKSDMPEGTIITNPYYSDIIVPIMTREFAEKVEVTVEDEEEEEAMEAQPVEEPAEQPVEEPAEQPAEEPVDQPAEEPAEQPAEEPAEQPVEEPAEQPAEEPAEQPAEQ